MIHNMLDDSVGATNFAEDESSSFKLISYKIEWALRSCM